MNEEVVLFGESETLIGIMTDIQSGEHVDHPAIIFLNSGFIHRIGPNRLYVNLARQLASSGFLTLRFDLSGIGDSRLRRDNLPIEKSAVKEVQYAMDFLTDSKGIGEFILVGLCSGAECAIRVASLDSRVVAAVCMNYQGEPGDQLITDRSHARYYWKTALFNPSSWLKAIRGESDYSSIIRLTGVQVWSQFSRKKKVSIQGNQVAANLRSLIERGVDFLLVYSDGDPGLDYFQIYLEKEIEELNSSQQLSVEIIRNANHMFGPLRIQPHLIKTVCSWIEGIMQKQFQMIEV